MNLNIHPIKCMQMEWIPNSFKFYHVKQSFTHSIQAAERAVQWSSESKHNSFMLVLNIYEIYSWKFTELNSVEHVVRDKAFLSNKNIKKIFLYIHGAHFIYQKYL